ncbi:MAG: glycosyltransferase [Actinomycetota bacterium]
MSTELHERVSLCIVPRERWSLSVRSLRQILDHVPDEIELVYVDGGSPDHIHRELESIVAERGGTFIRRDYVLATSEARNLAVAASSGEYLLFCDNDVEVQPGFLEALVACADETGAGAVGPLIMQGARGDSPIVHIAGGDIEITGDLLEKNEHAWHWTKIDDVPADALERRPSSQLEFHSILVRRAIFDDIGPFDEALLSMADHEDFVLLAAKAGWPLYFEPASRVTYLQFAPLTVEDRGFWQARWSEDWNASSLDAFAKKWNIQRDAGWPEYAQRWSSKQRMWWWHKQNKPMTFVGQVLRKAAMTKPVSRPVRALEERIFCRPGLTELRRREAALERERVAV